MKNFTLTLFSVILCLSFSKSYAQTISVTGNGQPIADGQITTSIADFTDFGTTTSRTFSINKTNTGNPKISVTSISLSNNIDFTITTNPAPVSGVSNKVDFTIGFNSSASCGTFTSIVNVYTNATNDGVDNIWTFTISATVSPEIDIVNASLSAISNGSINSPSVTNSTEFGNVGNGFSSAPVTFTIQNNSSACSLNLSGSPLVLLSNNTDFSVDYSLTTTPVIANGSTTFTITFNPVSSGIKTSIVSIANDDPNEAPYTFTVQGTGVAPQPEINVLGNAVSITDGTIATSFTDHTAFGNTTIGGNIVRTYTINNTGSATLNITVPLTLASTGTATGTHYAVTTQPAATVAPSGSTTFQVTFSPTVLGEFIDLISIANNDSDENNYTFAISGTSYITASGDTWYYYDNGTDLNASLPTWKTDTGIFSTWSAGPSQLGFGDGDEVTTVNNHGGITYYFRKQVSVSAADAARSTLVIRSMRDDGIIIYINGIKVWQNNMTASTINYTTPASSNISGNPENAWLQYKLINILNSGINEIAVEIHQDAPSSSDITFDFSMYTEDGNIPPDVDVDYVVDYLDNDVDGDGIPDIVEGCYTANLGSLHSSGGSDRNIGSAESINATINGSVVTMDDGNTITFTKTGTFAGIQSYFAGEHGWSVRTQGAGTNGTLEWDFGTDVTGLFFKLADFDENETYTVDVYDDTNTLIDLGTSGNVYQLGAYINQNGNTFNDKFIGNGINNDGDAVGSDPFGSVYFYFPNIAVSRIVFTVYQPNGSSIRITAMHFCSLDTDSDGIDDYHDSDSDNDGIPDLVEAGGCDTNGDGIIDNLSDTDGDGLANIYDSTPAVYFADETSTIIDYDLDGDGVPSRIDLDSDNDGIADIREAGDPDTNGDGQIDGFTDSNNDGYHDTYDGTGSTMITGPDSNSDGTPDSYPNDNLDGTGLPNFMDIDSDDDGIVDNTEAQPTGSYIAFLASDTDGDGIPNVFDNSGSWGGNGFTPVDTDNDGTPDYLDTDSDDAEESDLIEGHDTNGDGVIDGSDTPNANTGLFVGTDADGDGLDDGFDNNNAGFDPTNGALQATSHPIFDAGADRDWRSSTRLVALDFDGIDDHVDCGDESGFEFSSAFSIEAWVLQENTVATGTIAAKSNAKASNGRGYQLVLNNSIPNLKFYNNSGALLINITSPYAITNDRWYHIAATYDGTTARLYIDGIEVVNGTTSAPSYSTEKFLIGATYDSDTPTSPKNYFDGYIDEVRIWNTSLSVYQLREMMNQEIEQNGTAVRGKVIPINISGGLQWANLEAYYDMNDDDADDKSSNSKHGTPKNITTLQEQTAPLPYTTKADGNWEDNSTSTPWTLGDTVWDEPNGLGVDGTPIDWNIVVTDHNINIDTYTATGRERKILGLIVNSNKIQLNGDNTTKTGNGLTVTNYLKLDGEIDLNGESQLVQSEGSILDVTSSGSIERDQQGTKDLFTYNYWSSPVGVSNSVSNNNSYTLPNIFKDGTNPASPANITFLTSGYNGAVGPPLKIADYWIWKYANQISNTYSAWQHVRSTGSLLAGQGFTMKGVANTSGNITLQQNYVIKGKPNNGDISLTLAANNDYLVGNPYPSALDADEFIKDNLSTLETNGRNTSGNVINGALYFWDHFAKETHTLAEYEGGYATYTLMGGTAAISNDTRINATDSVGTKIPERYIPVGQGFFVSAVLDAGLVGLAQPVVGGNIVFKNSQRIFKKEAVTGSNSGSVFLRSNTGSSKEKSTGEKTAETIDTRPKIRLMYDSPKGYHRQLLVGVDENTTNDFDLGYDAPLIESNKEDLFWKFNNAKFTIQAVSNFDKAQTLPLGIKTSVLGKSIIRIEDLENIDEATQIFIHDKETNMYHNLRKSNFEIQLPIGEYLTRFEITFSDPNTPGEALGVSESELNGLTVYYSNESESIVLINPNQTEINNIELLNILGQSILKINKIGQQGTTEYKVKNLSSGTYVLKMHTVSGSVSKKVLVK